MTTREHQLADLFVEMINTHNPDLEDRFLAEDYINHEALFSAEGREANQQFWAAFFTGLPDVKVTMEDLVISGDRVVGRFTYRGTHTGTWWASPPPANRSRCAVSTSGASRMACSPSTGTS